MKFAAILFGLLQLLRFTAWRHPEFRKRLKEKNFTAQLRTKDGSVGALASGKHGRGRDLNEYPP